MTPYSYAEQVMPSSSPARGEIFSTINGYPLHAAFHYHLSIILIWLKYYWKGRKIAIHPSMNRSWRCVAYKNDNFRFHTFWVISPWLFQMQFHVHSITWILFGILSWYFTVMMNRSWRCITYRNDNSRFHTFWIIFPWWFQLWCSLFWIPLGLFS